MADSASLKIGITCYPSVGGSGILATTLGEELAALGHEIHFISYERPFRLPSDTARIYFHPVEINSYGLFKYPDYTLPLSVKLAEVSRDHGLDLIHAHYAVPHATAALLARDMLPEHRRPKVVTTLHGTDTTLLGRDAGYGPAIRHALEAADGVTTVSAFLRAETQRLIGVKRPIEVIHNFFTPRLGVADDQFLLFHSSNLRPVKRVDLVLAAFAQVEPHTSKLLILAGGDFSAFQADVVRLGLTDRVIVRENITAIEDYLQAVDLGLFASESESFCLSILEAMAFACPSVSTSVGGIPEVIADGESGLLTPVGDPRALAAAATALLADPARRARLGAAAELRAREKFSAPIIVERYLNFYHAVCGAGTLRDGAGL
ncbi:MAG: N-acetyl-alpha-D-glucosaminyl L-malate synthase BshA [Opitutaceae bacterium]|nr:N-acetyl-alpha-D-glucosaminyl L-malate synthase BshA [Opitutaceae bacterium]